MKHFYDKMRMVLCVLLCLALPAVSQDLGKQTLATQIEQAYNSFDFETVDRLLAVARQSIDQLPLEEQTLVYKYSAFRAFQNNRTTEAENNFRWLLQVSPAFSLDPVNTSPKLLLLFQQIKIEFYEELELRLQTMETALFRQSRPWRSLVFPGWEQWHRGHRVKGGVWAGIAILTIAGTTHAIVDARNRRSEYLDEADPALIPQRFDSYSDAFRSQYYWSYTLIGTWLSSHLDAVFFSEERQSPTFGIAPTSDKAGLGLTISW